MSTDPLLIAKIENEKSFYIFAMYGNLNLSFDAAGCITSLPH
jgi:hypothetical protein